MHVADVGEGLSLREWTSQPENTPTARMTEAKQDLEQSCLTGPVWPQQGENLARFDLEADPAQSLDRPAGTQRGPVRLCNIHEFGGGRHNHLIRAIWTPFCKMFV